LDSTAFTTLRVLPRELGFPIAQSLDVFKAVRASSLEIIKRLTAAQLDLSGTHSESGEYTIKTWLDTYISHPLEHAAQIKSGL
jgi:hypothetical protein